MKLEIVSTGYALAKTGEDLYLHKLAGQRNMLALLEFAEKQRPAGYGYMKALMG